MTLLHPDFYRSGRSASHPRPVSPDLRSVGCHRHAIVHTSARFGLTSGRKPVIRCSRCLPGSKPEGRHVVISYFASVFGLSTIVDHHACNRLEDGQEGLLMHVVRRSDTLVRPARRSTSARAPPITLPRTSTLSMESTSDLAICSTLLGPLGGLAPSP